MDQIATSIIILHAHGLWINFKVAIQNLLGKIAVLSITDKYWGQFRATLNTSENSDSRINGEPPYFHFRYQWRKRFVPRSMSYEISLFSFNSKIR